MFTTVSFTTMKNQNFHVGLHMESSGAAVNEVLTDKEAR